MAHDEAAHFQLDEVKHRLHAGIARTHALIAQYRRRLLTLEAGSRLCGGAERRSGQAA